MSPEGRAYTAFIVFVWVLVIGLLVVALSGCAETDNRPCLKSHEETITTFIYAGNGINVPVDDTYTVCDVYGPASTAKP